MNKRKVLFIVLPYLLDRSSLEDSKLRSFKAFPYGVLSIATFLKVFTSAGVQVVDCNVEDSFDVIKKIHDFKPDIVGLSMMFDTSYQYLKNISAIIKECNKEIVTVLGGASATSSYETIMKEQENIDGICISEGELPLLRLVNSENFMWLLENDVSWVTKSSLSLREIYRPTLIDNLDNVIDIDYSFVNIEKYKMEESFSPFTSNKENRKQFFLITSRGCPFKCSFCTHSSNNDKSMRYASIEKVIDHVSFLVSKYGMNVLTIYDDQLLFNRKRAKQLFGELAKFNIRIECPNGLSPAFIDDELAMLMRKAGMDTVCLAIESGSPYVLNKLIHKPLVLQKVKPVVQLLRKYGFWVQGYFVVGMPGETDEHRDETVSFIKDIGLDWSGFTLAIPSRGSELYRQCIKNEYIKKDIGISELGTTKFIINTPEYSSEYVTKKAYLMNLDVNFVNNYRMKQGDHVMALDCFQAVINKYPNQAFAYYYLVNMKKVYEIIEKEPVWAEYFKYFNIYDYRKE